MALGGRWAKCPGIELNRKYFGGIGCRMDAVNSNSLQCFKMDAKLQDASR